MRLRMVYEGARLSMRLQGIHSDEVALRPGHVVDRVGYLDGRGLLRDPAVAEEVPLVLFLHGLGSSVATWAPVLAKVARAVPVVAPDLPGYGRTPLPDHVGHASLHDKVDAVIGFIEAISPDRPVQLVGQSMGGWIAARVAAEAPERVGRLTLVNSAGILGPQVFRQRQLFTPANRAELRRLWRAMWHRLPLAYWAFEDAYFEMTRDAQVRGFLDSVAEDDFLNDHLGKITAPTLLVWGLSDELIRYGDVRYFREGLEDVRVRPIPDCGHVPQRERPQQFLRYVLPWLRGDEPPEPERPGLVAAAVDAAAAGDPAAGSRSLSDAKAAARAAREGEAAGAEG